MKRVFVNAKCPACGRLLFARRVRGSSASPRLPQHRAGDAIVRPWCQASGVTIKEALEAGVRNV